MSVPPHVEARIAFHQKLTKLLEAGCRRWQALKDGWSKEEIRRGTNGDRLKLKAFLDGPCSNAARKLYDDFEKATHDRERLWIARTLAFEHFVERLKRADNAIYKWFSPEELAAIEADFVIFWEIEKNWVGPEIERRVSLKMFRELGGEEIVAQLVEGSHGGISNAHEWINSCVLQPYRENQYHKSRYAASAVLASGIEQLKTQNDDQRRMRIGYGFAQCMANAAIVLINTRDLAGAGRLLEFNDMAIGSGCLIQHLPGGHNQVARLISRLSCAKQDDNSIREMWGALSEMLDINECLPYMSGKTVLMNNHFFLALIAQDLLLSQRSEIFSMIPPEANLTFVEGATGTEFGESLWQLFRNPEKIMEGVSRVVESGLLKTEPMHDALLSASWAKVAAQPDINDVSLEAEWIVRAAEALNGCSNYLAWSNVFSLSEQYMRRRGNKIMAEKAVASQLKLNQAALGEKAEICELTKRQEELERSPMIPTDGEEPSHEQKIRQLLRAEPPPLQRKMRHRVM